MLEWLCKYPAADFVRGRLVLASGWPWPILLGLWLCGAILIVLSVARRHRQLGAWRVAAIGALQLTVLSLALLIAWQPALSLRTLSRGQNAVAVLLDNSQSMNFVDPERTRRDQALGVLATPAFSELQNTYSLRRYAFAADATALESYATLPAAGDQTAIGHSVLQVLRQLRTTPLGALVVLSDGDDNAGAIGTDELNEIASFGVPVHTVGIGRERMPEDLELTDVLLPERALPGTTLAARTMIRHDGPGTAHLTVSDGGRPLASRDITLPADATDTSAAINLALNDSGDRELRFTLAARPDERELRNNSQTRIIDIADRKASVLYVEGEPRWEYKFMRRALEKDSGVRLASLLHTSPNGYYRQGLASPEELKSGFPTDRAALFRYDALIIGSVLAAQFTAAQQAMIRDFVSERGGSLLMLAGPNGLGDGGWGDTVVGRILPAQLPATRDSFHRVRAPVVLTARGRRTAMLQFSDDTAVNDKLWSELPPVADYQDVGALHLAATSLLNITVDQHQQPLLITQPYGRGRAYILASGGLWRWQMGLAHQDTRYVDFWRQLLRGLVNDVPQPFELTAHTQGGHILIHAEVRDASFVPMDDVRVQANVRSPTDVTLVTLAPLADQPGVYEAAFTPAASGSYVIDASARRGTQPALSAHAVTRYDQGAAEYFPLRQNRALLEQLAAATGGQYWRPEQVGALPQAIRASQAGIVQDNLLPLWDAPLAFIVLALLKIGEWLLRRRWSLV